MDQKNPVLISKRLVPHARIDAGNIRRAALMRNQEGRGLRRLAGVAGIKTAGPRRTFLKTSMRFRCGETEGQNRGAFFPLRARAGLFTAYALAGGGRREKKRAATDLLGGKRKNFPARLPRPRVRLNGQ